MRNKNLLLTLATAIICLVILGSCYSKGVEGTGNSYYDLAISTVSHKGTRTTDASLKAVTIPCTDNNTFRLYYSDSAATYGLPDSLTVVSYLKRTQLRYKQCYIEATSSATDTWLSTGYPFTKFKAGNGDIEFYAVSLRHFTSTPQSDSTTINARLVKE